MWLLVSVLIFFGHILVSGVTVLRAQTPLEVKAKSLTYEENGETVVASGDVVVTRGETTLIADTVKVSRVRNELEAVGNVHLAGPEGTIAARSLKLELEDETGEIVDGTVRIPRNQYMIQGRTLRKSYGQTYEVVDGSITTCECDDVSNADWSLDADRFDVTLGGTGKIQGGLFRVRDVPLLYIPYGLIPVRKERQSGMLAPKYSFSSKRGFQWEQPFYFALSKSQDATITADIETSSRLGLLGEYRYALSENTEGDFSASYFNERIRGPASTTSPTDRWSVAGTHRQNLPMEVDFYSDLFFVSDDFFLRELNTSVHPGLEDGEMRTRRFTDSRVGATKTWTNVQVRSEARYYQDLRNDQNDVFQILPQINVEGRRRFLRDRIQTGVRVEGTHFFRNRGYHGQRFDFAPWASMPFSLGRYLFGAIKVTGRETVYRTTSRAKAYALRDLSPRLGFSRRTIGGTRVSTRPISGTSSREIIQVEAEAGTRVSRVFDVGWGSLTKLQHVVEPNISFSYVPQVSQERLPMYDALDRVNRRSLFVYGFASRILGKFEPLDGASGKAARVRELFRFSVNHAYDPSRRLREGDEQFGLSETGRHFSDLDMRARIRPFSFLSIAAETTYDVDQGDMIAARIGGYLRDPRPLPTASPVLRHLQRRTSVGLSYRTIADRLLKELNSRVVLRLNDYFTVAYFTRYDLNDKSFIGSRYFFRALSPQKCWAFDFGVVEKVNPDETEFRFSISLVGITSMGKSSF